MIDDRFKRVEPSIGRTQDRKDGGCGAAVQQEIQVDSIGRTSTTLIAPRQADATVEVCLMMPRAGPSEELSYTACRCSRPCRRNDQTKSKTHKPSQPMGFLLSSIVCFSAVAIFRN